MGMLILIILVALVVFILSIRHFKEDMGSWFGSEEIIFSLLFSLLAVALTFIITFASSIFFDVGYKEEPTETIQITALKDNPNIDGSFFLGTGTVNETQKYYYMVDTKKGKQMRDVDADEYVYVKEGNIKQPNLETYDEVYTSDFAIFLYGEKTGYREYVFNIPEGSVTTEFSVDME